MLEDNDNDKKTTPALSAMHQRTCIAVVAKADTNDFQIFERMQDFERRNSMVYVRLQILH